MRDKYLPSENLPPHPLALIFPEMSQSEYRELVADIRAQGQLVPVTIHEGKVLDGRHRVRALVEIGDPVWVVDYDGDDPAGYVVSLNLHRRSLNEAQRGMVAAKLANLKVGDFAGNQHTSPASIDAPQVTQGRAAELMNVSRPTVQRARKVMETAPEVAAVVERGEMSLNLATKVAALPEPERQQVVALAEEPKEMRSAARRMIREEEAVEHFVPLSKPPSEARQFAGIAISQLRRIRHDDPERIAELSRVADWIKQEISK